ncbi:hypothetical protein Hamer_G009681 [Homarus americanus]|uniref:Uncharacterized protein n=2 Tax=Homarus americanus TaxID=6706 RepID=A0A8J5N318_HOMAM|nr:hypothetical protein Hamer_G009681 [Homarus americanus]
MVCLFLTDILQHTTEEDCGTPEDDDCFQEMLKGSPEWDDPQLLKVVREEFLRAPQVSPPPPPPTQRKHNLSEQDQEILKVAKTQLREVRFVVGVAGASPELVEAIGGQGLWVDPQPEEQPGVPPFPHLWYSHACLTAFVPYLNKHNQQCLSLSSLLHVLGRPHVDLVLAHTTHPARVLYHLCTNYDRPVKMVVAKKVPDVQILADELQDCLKIFHHLGDNITVFLINNKH